MKKLNRRDFLKKCSQGVAVLVVAKTIGLPEIKMLPEPKQDKTLGFDGLRQAWQKLGYAVKDACDSLDKMAINAEKASEAINALEFRHDGFVIPPGFSSDAFAVQPEFCRNYFMPTRKAIEEMERLGIIQNEFMPGGKFSYSWKVDVPRAAKSLKELTDKLNANT